MVGPGISKLRASRPVCVLMTSRRSCALLQATILLPDPLTGLLEGFPYVDHTAARYGATPHGWAKHAKRREMVELFKKLGAKEVCPISVDAPHR